MWLSCSYEKDIQEGEAIGYYPDGKLKRKESFENGQLKKGRCYAQSGKDTTYYPFEEFPTFKGGADELNRFYKKNLVYPMEARNKGIEGKVYVKFVINREGGIEDISVIKGVHHLLDSTAVDLISRMPRWNPGKQDGVPVKTYFNIPLNFKIQ